MQKVAPASLMDPARFWRLIDLVGAAQARAFRTQLAVDLVACDRRIALGAARRDWAFLRGASHDLISLAGSAGAGALHDLARDLNAAAHAEDAAALPALCDPITVQIAALVNFVRTAKAPERPS